MPGPELVRIELLGGFRVSVGPRAIVEGNWRLKKVASLIKLLALAPRHVLHRDQVCEWLWPELGRKAQANNLRGALHIARKTLEPEASSSGASGYLAVREEELVLCPQGTIWVDVEAFEEATRVARTARDPAAYRAAINHYAGELLPQDRYEPWTEERREGLRRTYLSLLVGLAGLYEEAGELEGAIEAMRKVVDEEPIHEEGHVGLMRLYALGGRRGEAVLQYERLRKALSQELGTEPGEAGRRLYEQVRGRRSREGSRAERRAEVTPDTPALHNLPVERTSFVGREDQIFEVERYLSMTRLLTLSGPGGSGKTRFALKVAREVADTYADGVWLVELAPLLDAELVTQAVASTLEVREQPGRPLGATLKDALFSKELLLVLDNCEHVIGAAARLAETLLDTCPSGFWPPAARRSTWLAN